MPRPSPRERGCRDDRRRGGPPADLPLGRFGLYSFFIDAPEPAIVDTGIVSSPAEGMAPALERLGRRIEDVRWILLTHGHIDHLGGAHALWELTGRRARVVIHEADAHLLASRRAHVDQYLDVRQQYLRDPDGEAKQTRAAEAVISGEMEPSVLVKGGETLSLGGDVTVSVHHVPGHTAGSVAYVVDGQDSVFVGDAVQVHGANGEYTESDSCGVGWAALFLLVALALPGVPLPVMMNVGVALVIFLILAVHPLLGRTPFGVLPAVLLGFVESLVVAAVAPMLLPGAPRLNLLWLIGIFAYGCVMTLILVVVEKAVLGRIERQVPGQDEPGRSATRDEAHR